MICDRYTISGMAYSNAKPNTSMSLTWCRKPDVNLPLPDQVIFLDIDPEEAAKRGGYGEERYEQKRMQEKVRETFYFAAQNNMEEARDMKIVSAAQQVDEVAQGIRDIVNQTLAAVERGERGKELRRFEGTEISI